MHSSEGLKKMEKRQTDIQKRAFQAKETANAEPLRWEHVWHVKEQPGGGRCGQSKVTKQEK